MTFEKFVDKIFLVAIIGIAGYGAAQVQAATASINELNLKMAVVIETVANQKQSVVDHEVRLRRLEGIK